MKNRKSISQEEFEKIMQEHKKFINGEGGKQADLSNLDLRELKIKYVDFSKAILKNVDLSRMNLENSRFLESDMENADLELCNLVGAWFCKSNLKSANLSGSDLEASSFEKADLEGAKLSHSNLKDAELMGANFKNSSLLRANLIGADLTDANLCGADLRRTNTQDIVGKTVISTQINIFNGNYNISYWLDLDTWTMTWQQLDAEDLEDSLKFSAFKNDGEKKRYLRAIEFIKAEAEDIRKEMQN